MKVWAFLATSLVSSVAAAQTTERAQEGDDTKEATTVRYQVTPNFGVTTAMGEAAPSVGLRALWGLNEIVSVGLGITALRFEEGPRGQQTLSYFGPTVKWSLRDGHRVHPVFELLPGYGRYSWESGSKGAGTLEFAAGVEVDASSFMRVGLAGVTRLTLVEDRHTLVDGQLSGIGARLSLSLGSF